MLHIVKEVIPMGTLRYKVVNAASLCVRNKPTLKGKVITYLHGGDTCQIVRGWSKTADGIKWFKLQSGNYVSSRYLQRVTPNYLKRTADASDRVYAAAIGCRHASGSCSCADIVAKKVTTCASTASAAMQIAGICKPGKLVSHTKADGTKLTKKSAISGLENLIMDRCGIVRANKRFKDLPSKYRKKGMVYVYDSNIGIYAGNNMIYSTNNGSSQLKNGRYIKDRMSSGYCFTSKVLYVIAPND